MILSSYERMIARRYLLPGRGEAFIFLVAGISLVAVMLGVAALVAVTSFMNGFRADLIVNNCFIVEVKSVERLAPVHGKQLLTDMKLSGCRLGLIITFGEELLKNGIKRVVN